MKGVHLQLFDTSLAQVDLSNIQASWWDVTEVKDFSAPIGQCSNASTDSSGYIDLDLTRASGLSIGQSGYLVLYKKDAIDHEDSLVFAGEVEVSTITSGTEMYYLPVWSRPEEWQDIAAPVDGVQKIEGLFGVYDQETAANACAFMCTAAYHVVWGDGTNEDVASGVNAEHVFDYADLANSTIIGRTSTKAVTFTASTNLVNKTGHGYSDDQIINFATIVTTTGISTYTKYFIISSLADSFQVSLTHGGSAIALTNDGSGTVFVPEYKLTKITITPQTSNNLITVHMGKRHSNFTGPNEISVPWKDIALNSQYFTSIKFSAVDIFNYVEQVHIGQNNLTTMSYMFAYCKSLQSVVLFDTSSVLTPGTAFIDCIALQSIPLLDLGAAINATYMFDGCYSLQSIPLLDTSSVTTMSHMFESCHSLQLIPLLNTAKVLYMSDMFTRCYSLRTIPLLDTGLVQDMNEMFFHCYALQSIPLLDTSSVDNMRTMFSYCYALQSIPLLDTSSVDDMYHMFGYCYALRSIPLLDTSSVTTTAYMFYHCHSLKIVPLLDIGLVTDTHYMFSNCYSLVSGAVKGSKDDMFYPYCCFGPEELDRIYTYLATASKIITVSNNWGTTSDDPSIATAKGWTVTG